MPAPRFVSTISQIASPPASSTTAPKTMATAFAAEPMVIAPRRCASDGCAAGATAPAPRRALRLADSATHRARLMLPIGR